MPPPASQRQPQRLGQPPIGTPTVFDQIDKQAPVAAARARARGMGRGQALSQELRDITPRHLQRLETPPPPRSAHQCMLG